MKSILAWGYDAPVNNDYLKDKTGACRYKIKKANKEYISEIHDNYRKAEYSPEKGIYLFNYLEEEGQDKWKKMVYEKAMASEMKETSAYKD